LVILIVIAVVLLVSLFAAARTIKVIPQARAGVVRGWAATTARSSPA
jgi:hypothetical protein